MASKVNTKFVLALVGGVIVLFGGLAGTYVFIQSRSGERNVRLGDAAMARGEYQAADILYGKAVNRENTNIEWLKKWRDAKLKLTPDTLTKYREEYGAYAGMLLRQIALSKSTDVQAHVDYLDETYRRLTMLGGGRSDWQFLADEAQSAIKRFGAEEPLPLRRYRGIAQAGWAGTDPQIDPDRRAQAETDLNAVLEKSPTDTVVATALVQFYADLSEQARASNRSADATKAREQMRSTLQKYLAANPTAGDLRLQELVIDTVDAERSIDMGRPIGEIAKARNEMIAKLKPRIEATQATLLQSPPESLTPGVISRFLQIATRIDPVGGAKLGLAVLDRALQAKPGNSSLLMLLADAQTRAGNNSAAQEALAKIVAAPDQPLSVDGLLLWAQRNRARFMQANLATIDALQATDEAVKTAAIERAKAARTTLALHVPEDSPQLTLIDGRIAAALNEPRKAQALLEKFIKTPGDIADQEVSAMLLLADMCARVREPGRARDLLVQIESRTGGTVELAIARGDLELELRNFDEALRIYEQVLAVSPGNERVTRNREIAKAMAANPGADTPKIEDPVTRLLVEFGRLNRDEGRAAALARLEKGLEETKFDTRVVQALMAEYGRDNNVEKAREIVNRALASRPDEKLFQDLKRGLDSVNDLDKMLALVDSNTVLTPAQKMLAKADVYQSFNKADDARRMLAEAVKLEPNNAIAVERLFADALSNNKLDEAEALAERAAKENLDLANGDTYAARLALARKDPRGAATLLQRAVDRGNAPVAAHRLLGQVLASQGRTREAVQAFKRAFDLNPTDQQTILSYVAMLAAAGQRQDALTLARQVEPIMRGNPQFEDIALNLEANIGNAAVAKERRAAIYKASPDNRANAAALAGLHMSDKEFDAARTIIDALKAKITTPDVGMATLEARWYADQAQLEQANKVFDDLAAKLREEKSPAVGPAILAQAQFLSERGLIDAAVAAARKAREFQDPKTLDVDRAIAETQLTSGRFADAEATYRQILEAGVADPERSLAKRLIETLVQQDKHTEAKAEIAKLGTFADEDLEVLLQRASIARASGSRREAREILDKAVQRFPTEALPYTRRARLQMGEPGSERDAIDDLDTAVRLQPNLWSALQTRGKLRLLLNQTSEGLRDLTAAMEAAPSIEDLRYELIDQLLSRKMEGEAVNVADAGKKLRPNNIAYLSRVGQSFVNAGQWNRAVPYFRDVYRLNPEVGALAYVQTLLASTPPAVNEAEAVLRAPGMKVDGNTVNLLVRAAIRRHQKRDAEAKADVRASLAAINSTEATALNNWYSRFRQVFRDSAAAMGVIDGIRTNTVLDQWLDLWRTQILLQEPKTRAQGIDAAKKLVALNPVVEVKATAYLALTNGLIIDERWDEALKELEAGIKVAPNDPIMLNNYGYILVTRFNRGKEAIEIADRLYAASKDVAALNDTTATIYWEAGQKAKAIEIQRRAARTAASVEDAIRYRLKLAKWLAESQDKVLARVEVETLAEFLVETPSMRESVLPELEKLRAQLKD